jgi:ABC-type transport system involved in multi-copper enzyme maturation permease subunit
MSAAVTPDAAAPESTRARGARLGAYAPWQMRDYLIDRGAPTVLIGLLFGYMVAGGMLRAMNMTLQQMSTAALARAGGAEAARASAVANLTTIFLDTALGNLVFLGALFAMNGIVANDRKQGFYRFLFSKPVAPDRYYGQAFLVHWAGFLLVVTALGLVYQAVIGPVLSAPLYLAVSLLYLCYAGIAFALSAAARWDWLSLVAVTVASNYLWLVYGASNGAAAWLLYLFPPIHRTSAVYAAVAGGTPLPWDLLAWFAGYGAICFAIGLVVLRRRRLAII